MKFITRRIETYTHHFGKYNPETDEITDKNTLTTSDKLSMTALYTLAKEQKRGMYLKTNVTTATYYVPVDVFVNFAYTWMEKNPDMKPVHLKEVKNDD